MAKRKRNAASKPPALDTSGGMRECQDQEEGPPAKRLRSKYIASPFTTPSKAVAGRTVPEEHQSSGHVGQTSTAVRSKAATTKIYIKKLVINVPPGHQGPLQVKLELPSKGLDCSSTLNEASGSDNQSECNALLRQTAGDRTTKTSQTPCSRAEDESRCGFLSLPAELRDMIYEDVFVLEFDRYLAPVDDTDTRLCAALLRTCRQVYQEGRKWLYSENRFIVRSDWRTSGGYWEPKWSALGYETMKMWFSTIGTENTQLLQNVYLHFADFSIRDRPYETIEERRYVRDPHIVSILDQLSACKSLKRLKISFNGKYYEILRGAPGEHELTKVQVGDASMA